MQTDTYWFKKNKLGDIAEIYGVNGKICEYRCDAWGNYRLIDSGTGMDVTKDQVIGGISTNVSAHIGHINPFRYRGYYYDEETGFYYLNTRYYDPEIRRFINMDNPELVAQLAQTPGQLNLYAYCNNNPVAFTDESGESFLTVIIIGAIVTILAGIDGGLSAIESNGDFWIGFGAGALGGALGYVATAFGHPFLGRAISSAVYDIANPFFQKGKIEVVDLLALIVDIPMDLTLGAMYYCSLPCETTGEKIFSNILSGLIDGIIDIGQTQVYNLMGEYMNRTQQSSSDVTDFYCLGI